MSALSIILYKRVSLEYIVCVKEKGAQPLIAHPLPKKHNYYEKKSYVVLSNHYPC